MSSHAVNMSSHAVVMPRVTLVKNNSYVRSGSKSYGHVMRKCKSGPLHSWWPLS